MKNLLLTTTAGLLTLLMPLLVAAQDPPSVEERLSSLERRMAAIEASQGPAVALTPEARESTGRSPLKLLGWDYRFEKGSYNQHYYTIGLNIRNDAPKAVKLVDASILFQDLLGAKLFAIKVNPDLALPAGKPMFTKGNYSINQFMPEEARMANLKREDIKVTLTVRKLVFEDNTIAEFNP